MIRDPMLYWESISEEERQKILLCFDEKIQQECTEPRRTKRYLSLSLEVVEWLERKLNSPEEAGK